MTQPTHGIAVPARFAADRISADGEPARHWIEALPELVSRYIDHWSLTVAGDVMHGFGSLVVPVRRPDGTDAVLKMAERGVQARARRAHRLERRRRSRLLDAVPHDHAFATGTPQRRA